MVIHRFISYKGQLVRCVGRHAAVGKVVKKLFPHFQVFDLVERAWTKPAIRDSDLTIKSVPSNVATLQSETHINAGDSVDTDFTDASYSRVDFLLDPGELRLGLAFIHFPVSQHKIHVGDIAGLDGDLVT